MPRVTLKKINAALLAEFGSGIELNRGRWYFYFTGPLTHGMQESGIYTNHLTGQSVADWVTDARLKLEAINA